MRISAHLNEREIVATEKQIARKSARAARDALSAQTRATKSASICAQAIEALDAANLPKGAIVALYAPMGSEVDVLPCAAAAEARGWRPCYPAMLDAAEAEAPMAFFQASTANARAGESFLGNQLKRYTIAELTAQFAHVAPDQIDAIIVPLVAFDETNARLGYGGGNYDRYLPQLRPDAFVAGVAFAEQRIDRVPTDEHDRPLPRIFTA